jgi:hypothetical protein
MAAKKRREKGTKGTLSAKEADGIINALLFQRVGLLDCETRIRLVNSKLPDKILWNLGFAVKVAPDRKAMVVLYQCSAAGVDNDKPESTAPENSPLVVNATFQATYFIDPDADLQDAQLEIYVATVGAMEIWPYWREFISSMTSRMGIPTLMAPPLHTLTTEVVNLK